MSIRDISNKLMLCLKSRSIVIIVYTWPALIAFLISSISASIFSTFALIRVITSVTLVGYGVYFYNDLMDSEDDRKNMEVGSPFPANRPRARPDSSGGAAPGKKWVGSTAWYLMVFPPSGIALTQLLSAY